MTRLGKDLPWQAGLTDEHGRVARNLRVSLTDRCNLRCAYCMPPEGLPWMPRGSLLTDDEVVRLVRIGVELLGIRSVRFTGGEPLLRTGLEEIVAASAAFRGPDGDAPHLALTTNGIGLARRAAGLAAAGIGRVNVSLDTLVPERFAALTHRDRLPDVIDGMAAARAAGMRPVKLNSVLLRGVNDDEAGDLLQFALEHRYFLRFIEQMPIGPADAWDPSQVVTAQEILDRLAARFTLTPLEKAVRGPAPARTWLVDGGPGAVGVIASVSWPFCDSCDRVRLTADGKMRNCLFAQEETDLLGPMRAGADDVEIAQLWRAAVRPKPQWHGGIGRVGFVPPERTMSRIGG
ncbi:GTP 3',8-cyclase MoaA [Cellulomonas sp. C5510]|uniref:GTP 3',8-cyclase MoaA n=1 Tax=Cellulomonas sp. C5510 TaxID=2871170 RepID=UPI001C94B56C|nr:GTP 3',8-cyclase MoaA [Cellulomonas sp. C5510]QZN84889.1 GTP 3',8-cyclase MoaA [Cellulomonas sp. C5510]